MTSQQHTYKLVCSVQKLLKIFSTNVQNQKISITENGGNECTITSKKPLTPPRLLANITKIQVASSLVQVIYCEISDVSIIRQKHSDQDLSGVSIDPNHALVFVRENMWVHGVSELENKYSDLRPIALLTMYASLKENVFTVTLMPAVVVTATINVSKVQDQDIINAFTDMLQGAYRDGEGNIISAMYSNGNIIVETVCQIGSLSSITQQLLQNISVPGETEYWKFSLKQLLRDRHVVHSDTDSYIVYGIQPPAFMSSVSQTGQCGSMELTCQLSAKQNYPLVALGTANFSDKKQFQNKLNDMTNIHASNVQKSSNSKRCQAAFKCDDNLIGFGQKYDVFAIASVVSMFQLGVDITVSARSQQKQLYQGQDNSSADVVSKAEYEMLQKRLVDERATANKQIGELNAKLNELQKQATTAAKQDTSQSTEAEAHGPDELDNLKQQLQQLQEQSQNYQGEIARYRQNEIDNNTLHSNNISLVAGEVQRQQAIISNLTSQLQQYALEHKELQEECDRLRKNQATGEVKQLKAENEKLQLLVNKMDQEYDECQDEIQELRSQLQKLRPM